MQKPRRVARIAAAFLREPAEALGRVRDKQAERRDRARPAPVFDPVPDVPRAVHGALRTAYPCRDTDHFNSIAADVRATFVEKGLAFGRAAYGGWDDADGSFAQAVWCVVRHTKPEHVIETGVARGVTTRFILEALARNGRGHLWSVDLPPLLERSLSLEIAAVVPAALRRRWTFVEGSSRTQLPRLLRALGSVDVFVHDSFHSSRNFLFEWEAVLPHLHAGGVLIADDVHRHHGVETFRSRVPGCPVLVCAHSDGQGFFALAAAGSAAERDATS